MGSISTPPPVFFETGSGDCPGQDLAAEIPAGGTERPSDYDSTEG